MDAAGFLGAEFPVGWCASCSREVLTCLEGEAESDARRCVHCDTRVTDGVRLAKGAELVEEGYREIELRGGCGNGGACRRA